MSRCVTDHVHWDGLSSVVLPVVFHVCHVNICLYHLIPVKEVVGEIKVAGAIKGRFGSKFGYYEFRFAPFSINSS